MPLLEVRNLNVHYGAIHALQGITLDVEEGRIVTLLGANGAGKTTTLRALSGLVKPSSGTVRFGGRDLAGLPPHTIVSLGMAHVPEGRGVFPEMTVEENLHLGAYSRRDRSTLPHELEQVLVLFPRLRERFRQQAGTLSGGEQQMLAIGRALLARPKLLLLDEPSLGLAPQIVTAIFRIIRQINRQHGTTILLVEQNAHMALLNADYGYVLEVGRVVMQDEALRLAESDEVRRAYLGHG